MSKYMHLMLYLIPHATYVDCWKDKEAFEWWKSVATLGSQALITALIYIYLSQVIPDEFGVSKHWLFPFKSCCKKKQKKITSFELAEITNPTEENFDSSLQSDREMNKVEDDDEDLDNNIVEILNLCKEFGDHKVLKGININLKKGKLTSLIGHNGAGKSTLVNILCGIIKPSSGELKASSLDIYENYDKFTKLIGYCPSYNVVYDELTVGEHLKFICILKGMRRRDIKQEIEKQLENLDFSEFKDTRIANLSGGSLRKLTLASALVKSPKLLILDEPTNGVDAYTRKSIWSYLQAEKVERDTSILLTTHYLREAEKLSD